MKLNEKILYLRNRERLSQEAFARRMHVSRQAVSKWELGDALPDADKIVLMSEEFQVTTDWLLKEQEELPSNTNTDMFQKAVTITSMTVMLLTLGASYLCWHMWQNPLYNYLCLIPEVIAFVIGWILLRWKKTPAKQAVRFIRLSIWLLLPIPSYLIKEALLTYYPSPYTFLFSWMVWLFVYVGLGIVLHLIVKHQRH